MWTFLAAVALGLFALLSSTPTGYATDRVTRRVLFIGNSYTRFNNLPRMVEQLSRSAPSGAILTTVREARAGFNLRRHWQDRGLRARIRRGRFDAIVLQGHSLAPFRAPDRATEYSRRFSEHASEAGTRVILFETWARHPRSRTYRRLGVETPDEMLAEINTFYRDLASELRVPVAPVGRAWERALEALPQVELHRRDGTHPAPAGTYLAACVLYGTLTGVDPREATWRPWPMQREQAERIREIAAETLARQ